MNNNIRLPYARKQAQYYGKLVQKENEVERSDAEKQYYNEQLSYYRTVILFRTLKTK